MKPVCVEVVSTLFTSLGNCRHCDLLFQESGVGPAVQEDDQNAYPPQFHEEWKRLREILLELKHLYQHRIDFRLVEADSLLGLYKAVRHRFRKYPTFILDKKDVYTGWNIEKIENLLDARLHQGGRTPASI
ncbi:MAG TPA: hypothetical protein PLB96_06855 [Syntrophales bacterium]|nr:hypothetical protein [Syntrophales bacterium]